MQRITFKREWLGSGILSALAIIVSAGMAYPLQASPRFRPEGTQYQIAGTSLGDQLAPSLSIKETGGWLAWHDNTSDGEGFGVSIRRLSSQLTGMSSFRVNQRSEGIRRMHRSFTWLTEVPWSSGKEASVGSNPSLVASSNRMDVSQETSS